MQRCSTAVIALAVIGPLTTWSKGLVGTARVERPGAAWCALPGIGTPWRYHASHTFRDGFEIHSYC
jgi:hypothetical protein